jgi:hypothetical protein
LQEFAKGGEADFDSTDVQKREGVSENGRRNYLLERFWVWSYVKKACG